MVGWGLEAAFCVVGGFACWLWVDDDDLVVFVFFGVEEGFFCVDCPPNPGIERMEGIVGILGIDGIDGIQLVKSLANC